MKKLAIIAAVALSVASVKAASVSWSVAGTSATSGYTVYLLTSLASNYESVSDLASKAVSSGNIVSKGRGAYAADGVASGASVTSTSMANAYYVIVASGDASSYTYYQADLSSKVYDPENQESSPGAFNTVSAATILSSGTSANFQSVPEPTSGLLMLLGVAGLALRRRRA